MTIRRWVPLLTGILCAVLWDLRPSSAAELPRPVALQGSVTPDGAAASIHITVRNPAADRVSPAAVLEVYLSRDGLIDDADARLDRRPVAPLAAGARAEYHVRPALGPQAPGQYYIVARVLPVDPDAPQPRATDALWGAPLSLGPDLLIEDLRATHEREGLRLKGRVRNRGTHAVTTVSVGAAWTRGDQEISRAGESAAVHDVPAGGSAAFELVVTPGVLPAGEYGVAVDVDPDQRVPESDEENNRLPLDIGLRVGPDLVVIDLSASQAGGAVLVRDTVSNRGNRLAEACGILFFLSRNGVWDQGDVSLGYRLVPALDPGAESRAETSLAIPPRGLATGRYFLIAKVDGADTVVESDETNNLALAQTPLDLRLQP